MSGPDAKIALHRLGVGPESDTAAPPPARTPRAVAAPSIPPSWMLGHIQMHQPPPAVGQHHEHEQHSKGRRWHREEIQRDEIFAVLHWRRSSAESERGPRG